MISKRAKWEIQDIFSLLRLYTENIREFYKLIQMPYYKNDR